MEWGVHIIKYLLEMADKIWTFRCHLLQGEEAFTDLEEKRKALAWLQALYLQQNEVSPQDIFVCQSFGGLATIGCQNDCQLV